MRKDVCRLKRSPKIKTRIVIGHFRVALNPLIKARLSEKFLLWKLIFFHRADLNWVSKVISRLLWFCFTSFCDLPANWLPTSSTNQQQNQNQSWLVRKRFPALGAFCMYLIRFLIGSRCLRLLWSARVITSNGFGFTTLKWKQIYANKINFHMKSFTFSLAKCKGSRQLGNGLLLKRNHLFQHGQHHEVFTMLIKSHKL